MLLWNSRFKAIFQPIRNQHFCMFYSEIGSQKTFQFPFLRCLIFNVFRKIFSDFSVCANVRSNLSFPDIFYVPKRHILNYEISKTVEKFKSWVWISWDCNFCSRNRSKDYCVWRAWFFLQKVWIYYPGNSDTELFQKTILKKSPKGIQTHKIHICSGMCWPLCHNATTK